MIHETTIKISEQNYSRFPAVTKYVGIVRGADGYVDSIRSESRRTVDNWLISYGNNYHKNLIIIELPAVEGV